MKRLLRLVSAAAKQPAGRLPQVIRCRRELDGAYDLLEERQVRAEAVLSSCVQAAVRRCRSSPFAYVPVDGSSLSMSGEKRKEAFGAVGSHKLGGRGLKVMTALVVTPDGVPQGLGDQKWWMRPQRKRLSKCTSRAPSDRESRFWLQAISDTRTRFGKLAPGTRPWFQLDREGDSLAILDDARTQGYWLTTRARLNRRLRFPGEPLRRYRNRKAPLLRDHMAKQVCLGTTVVDVKSGDANRVRKAILEVRAASVFLERSDLKTSAVLQPVPINAVHVGELNPTSSERLDWLLLTTAPIETFEDAKLVVAGYAMRWRIEEFHRTWKSGGCNVEETQLRHPDSVKLWATILAAVATRIERLKYLARTQPELPATTEFDASELEAIRLLKRRHDASAAIPSAAQMTIGEATRFIAAIGGHLGRPSDGHAGSTTIGRGLDHVQVAADVIRLLKTGLSPPSETDSRR